MLSIEVEEEHGCWSVIAILENKNTGYCREMTLRHSFETKKDALATAKKFRAFFAPLSRTST